ncbi:MAG: quinone-dependent dihydroorotate dehydrogenase [Acidobacteria bacterium]|nr:MAG: quinone-dependent dihydroorotate dehydrogenase [Acidobacteriota bacterium]
MRGSAMLFARTLRPALFALEPETAHRLVVGLIRAFPWFLPACRSVAGPRVPPDPALAVRVGSLLFPCPLGISAGLDKNGEIAGVLSRLGTGFVEVGSVCRDPNAGHPRPRLFRLPKDRSLLVHYGNPSRGAAAVARRLAAQRFRAPVGVSLVPGSGSTADDTEGAVAELAGAARLLAQFADYFVLNTSCPNVSDVGWEGGKAPVATLRAWVEAVSRESLGRPLFLKVPPVAEPRAIEAILRMAEEFPALLGFAFNLPRQRPAGLRTPAAAIEGLPGALAGPPTAPVFEAALAAWRARTKGTRVHLFGGGGVVSAADAYRRIRLGASLVPVCTALVFQGPGLPAALNRDLSGLLRRDGFKSVSEAVGVDVDGSLSPGVARA